jgi:hypothetical protein
MTSVVSSANAMAKVVMVDQFQPGTSSRMSMVVGQVPFSRLLENKLGQQEPAHKTLLAIQATQTLFDIQRGDPRLVICNSETGIDTDSA